MFGSGAVRRRKQASLAAMVHDAVRCGDYRDPWRHCPEALAAYGGESGVLRQLQRDWSTALAGAVYVAIEAGQGNLQHDVLVAWRRTEQRHAGTRRILEAHRDHPAIAAAMRKEQALLSSCAAADTLTAQAA